MMKFTCLLAVVVLASCQALVAADSHADHTAEEHAAHAPESDDHDDHAGETAEEHAAHATESGDDHDDHSDHDHSDHSDHTDTMGSASVEKVAAPASQTCQYQMSKCTVNKAWVRAETAGPESWGYCTENNDPDAGHALGWDCASDTDNGETKAELCSDKTILHTMPMGAHNMVACVPSEITDANAQTFWDAFIVYDECLEDDTMLAADCTATFLEGFTTELELIAPGMMPEGLEAKLSEVADICTAATTEAECNAATADMGELAVSLEGAVALSASAPEETSITTVSGAAPAVSGVAALATAAFLAAALL